MNPFPYHLKELDTPLKVLFTGYLMTVGVGYLMALIQILFTHGMADGKFGLSIDDVVYSYYGNRSGTLLEQKLNGSMQAYATEQERFELMQWTRDGARAVDYVSSGSKAIIEKNCVMCHNEDASGIPNYNDFEQLKAVTQQDEGATFSSLTRVSHIHLFGISFIFMFVGLIFSFSQIAPSRIKSLAIGMPYIFLLADIMSWWLTKLHPWFAWMVIIAGFGMGLSFLLMWVLSMLEMWAFRFVFVDGIAPKVESCRSRWVEKLSLPEDAGLDRCLWQVLKKTGRWVWGRAIAPLLKRFSGADKE
ncbi:MAG: hypothetical protein RQ715_00895 [Methylococcales bacterium]|nr:hypothetical protein [Methylococcales bacterium]